MIFRTYLLTIFFVLGCLNPTNPNEKDDENSETIPQDELACDANDECIFTDHAANLDWQGCPAGQTGENCEGHAEEKKHAEALDYCENLFWGGFDDWHLPNIDELRTLIRGCETTEPGTSCGITHQCSVDNNCSESHCNGGCGSMSGPGAEGCFWPVDFPGECNWLWSSSLKSGISAYYVDFTYADVFSLILEHTGQDVRCVRSRT